MDDIPINRLLVYGNMTLRNKLTFGALIIVFLSYLILAIVVSIYVNRVFLRQVQIRVRHDLYSAHQIYEGHVEQAEQILTAISVRRQLEGTLEAELEGDLGKVFQNVYISSGLDILTMVGMDGEVLYRAHNPGVTGDDISGLPVVRKVLQEWEPARGTVILPAELMKREGTQLSERARISIFPTPLAEPSDRTAEERGMFIVAAVPVHSLNTGEKLGILMGGYLLNRNQTIVDQIKEKVFEDPVYEHGDVGTATIFFDDLRVSTNVLMENDQRAIGSRLSAEVYEHVIRRGLIWSDRAFVVNDWYITSYEPIRDLDDEIIGSLYVGVLEAPYKQPGRVIILFVILMLCFTAMAAFLLTYFYLKRMLIPVDGIIEVCRNLMQGELSSRCTDRASGEMGLLCSSINQMADAFEKHEKNLLKETQLQIGQSEKLAAIGRLAAGIAHEINNPLTSVMNFAYLLKDKEYGDEQTIKDLEVIIGETNRVRKIVRELLDFARQSPGEIEPVDINQALQQLTALIVKQKEFRQIRFIDDYDGGLQMIPADRNQLQQVFLNLLLNSAESITGEGKITIATKDGGEHCLIHIGDTGCGIKSGDLDKIFDPFYTTKPPGKGTGLGLSVSYGILKQYGGDIQCESRVGEGTTFTVQLPYRFTSESELPDHEEKDTDH